MNVGGGGKAPITIGINPTIAFYSIILGGACALAAYTEKYRRDQDEIDDRLKERYFTNMKEQQAKMPLITQTIRGQDARLNDAMNKWVWGGKADLSGSTTAPASSTPFATSTTTSSGGGSGGGGGNTTKATLVVPTSDEEDESDSSSSSDSSDDSDSDSSSSSSATSEEELEQEKKLSKKERRQRRKERKQRREARRKKREEEKQRRLEAERQKLVLQSVAAGVTVGAAAVALTMLLGNRRN